VLARKAIYRAKYPEKCRAGVTAWAQANPDKKRASDARYAAANKDKLIAYHAEWRKKNTDKVNAWSTEYRLANPEKAALAIKAWNKANPERLRVNDHNARARRKAAPGRLSPGLTKKLLKLQKGRCACCKLPLGDDFHLDNITPIARGGANADGNMQLLRAVCNLKKSAKDPIDYMQSKGFLI